MTLTASKPKRHRGVLAWLIAAVMAMSGLALSASAAQAAEVEAGDTVYVGQIEYVDAADPDLGFVFPVWAGVEEGAGQPDRAPDFYAYCVEPLQTYAYNTTATVGEIDGFLGNAAMVDPTRQTHMRGALAYGYPATSLEELRVLAGIPTLSEKQAINATHQVIFWALTASSTGPIDPPGPTSIYRLISNSDDTVSSDPADYSNARDLATYLVEKANNANVTLEDLRSEVTVTAPSAAQNADSLVGPFTVNTNRPTASVTSDPTFTITDASGDPIDTGAVTDGQEIYLDLRGNTAVGSATVTASVTGSAANGMIISVPLSPGQTPTEGAHGQTLGLIADSSSTVTASAQVAWAGDEEPTGNFDIVKVVEGDAAGLVPDDAEFEVEATWDGGSETFTIKNDGVVVTSPDLPLNTEITVSESLVPEIDGVEWDDYNLVCDIEEDEPGGWDRSVPVSGEPKTFTLTSYEQTGYIQIVRCTLTNTANGAPVVEPELPDLRTSATTDNLEDDKVVPLSGATITDVVTYENVPQCVIAQDGIYNADPEIGGPGGARYEEPGAFVINGELMFVDSDDTVTSTGITGTSGPITVPGDGRWVSYQWIWENDPPSSFEQMMTTAYAGWDMISGNVEIDFNVTAEQAELYSGGKLVVFETLSCVDTYDDENIGSQDPHLLYPVLIEHHDIADLAQTVTVDEEPVVEPETPVIGTSLVDTADGDRVLAWNGGVVRDTVAYQNLVPGTEYTVSGELMNKADGTGTGITSEVTFTPTEADGSVDLLFTVPVGYAGSDLVAFEWLFEGDTAGDRDDAVAEHTDIDDPAQTVTVEEEPAVEPKTPVIGTSLVDVADGDRVLAWDGGKVTDTVAYKNLTPGTEYTISGELMNKADGKGTGITASVTFTPTKAEGEVDLTFTVPKGYAGEKLVAFEWLFEGDTAGDRDDAVAEHTDIDDAAQTVTVANAPASVANESGEDALERTGGELPFLMVGIALLLVAAGVTLPVMARRRA